MQFVYTSWGEYITGAYFDSLAFVDDLGNAAVRESRYGITARPGGAGLSDAERRQLFGALRANGDPVYTASLAAINAPGSSWRLSGTDYDATLAIPAAADRDQSLLAEVGPVVGVFVASAALAGGISSAFAGAAESVAGGLEVFTAQDVAQGAAMLENSGVTYAQFLESMNSAAALGAQAAPVSNSSSLADWSAAADAADATQGAAMLENSGLTYSQITAGIKSPGLLDQAAGTLKSLASRAAALLNKPATPAPTIAAPVSTGGGSLLPLIAIIAGVLIAK